MKPSRESARDRPAMDSEMKMRPAVSIVIPTYRHREFICQTLNSAFAQTFSDFEVIVVDDGSPDDTADLLNPLVEQGRLRLIRQDNAGQAAARNRGVAEAAGEYIAFLDDDDLWPPDKLSWQVASLRDDPTAVAIGGALQCIDLHEVAGYSPKLMDGEVTFTDLFSGSPFWSPGQTLIRASALQKVGPLDTTIPGADDLDLWLRLAKVGKIRTDSRLSLRYRKHGTNASKNLELMYDSCRRVVRKHLTGIPRAERRGLAQSVQIWLYDYLGTNALKQSLTDTRQLKLMRAAGALLLWTKLIHPGLTNNRVRSAAGKDLRELIMQHWPFRLLTP